MPWIPGKGNHNYRISKLQQKTTTGGFRISSIIIKMNEPGKKLQADQDKQKKCEVFYEQRNQDSHFRYGWRTDR